MKKDRRFGLCVLLVFVFSFCVYEVSAQPNRAAMRTAQQNTGKRMLRSYWDGDNSLMFFGMIQQDDMREGFGVSKEQFQKMQDDIKNMQQNMANDPEFKPIQEEMVKLASNPDDNPFSENASPQTQEKFAELQQKIIDISFRRMDTIINESITSEQKQKIKEFQISTMSELPLVSPSMFEALDLSDDQKKELSEIKKKLEPEFEKNIDEMINSQVDYNEKLREEVGDKTNGVTDSEEIKRIYEDAGKKVKEKHPEYQQMRKNLLETGKAFANKLKFQMFDVLTDEQMERMAQLIDNPPDYVKKLRAQIRKNRGEKEDEPSGEWKPGLDSWKPGDPIPKEYLEQRKSKRFPSKSNKN